jgi:CDP-2,3-bis-(O-geranylgeranyl)-sn-glycerol synthase
VALSSDAYFTLAVIPALAANGAPVAFSKILKRVRLHPIDGGRYFVDGRRLLGDGKTIEGFSIGVFAGFLIALIEAVLVRSPSLVLAGVVSSVGAMLGDIAGSFIKRRIGIERGQPAPLLDQLDFYIGAVFFLWILGVRASWEVICILAGIVIVLHVSTNYLAYKLNLKNVPW